MIALFYRLFKSKLNRLAWIDQNKPNPFAGLEFAFNLNGVDYCTYRSVFDMPMVRMGKVQVLLAQLASCISSDELDRFVAAMKGELDKATQGTAVKNLARIGWLIEEMNNRKTLLVHTDIMLQICAASVMAKGIDPAVWNEDTEKHKYELFKSAYSTEGLAGFFQQAGLTQFLPRLNDIEKDLTRYLAESDNYLKAQAEVMKSFNEKS